MFHDHRGIHSFCVGPYTLGTVSERRRRGKESGKERKRRGKGGREERRGMRGEISGDRVRVRGRGRGEKEEQRRRGRQRGR